MYDFKTIEKKWQDFWEKNSIFNTNINFEKKKFFCLVEFPYPSGKGLHVGHPRSYTAMDIIARKRRMQGYNVLYCIGWDAFGLPTENFAIKNKKHPSIVTQENIDKFRKQLKSLGLSFDWSREINTTDDKYYKWTQWIFIKLFKKGLAYKSKTEVNWCEYCKCVLANEEVKNDMCNKCSNIVSKKTKNQWLLKITKYADRLIKDLKDVEWPDKIKKQQINWIGKSIGIKIKFKVYYNDLYIDNIEIFTTKPYTIFGVTYFAISSKNIFLTKWKKYINNFNEITMFNDNNNGIKIDNIYVLHPYNNEKINIFVANYVLNDYGTGIVMGVPSHDKRDYDFSKKNNIKTKKIINEKNVIINSEFLNNLNLEEANEIIIKRLMNENIGIKQTQYHLKDWIFSRQRYWGEPIPMIFCSKCGWIPIPEKDLPLKLPEIKYYNQTENGESPLALIDDWVNIKCHICNNNAKRETDTMPQWAGSSWYYIRYLDPNNFKEIASKEYLDYWLPVDWYNGGMEHTTLHLLYSRFWHKFLYDIKVLNCNEPYIKRSSQGMILGTNHEKMSKSKGNVINPDDIINQFGADTLRLYEMFIGDFEQTAIWSHESIIGCQKFLNRIFVLKDKIQKQSNINNKNTTILHQTIKKVSEDIENMKFNTAISSLMTLTNYFYKNEIYNDEYKTLLILISPFAPHLSEEIWEIKKYSGYVHQNEWPKHETKYTIDDFTKIIIQINGNMKKIIKQKKGLNQEATIENNKKIIEILLNEKNIIKIIYIMDKVINFVVKN